MARARRKPGDRRIRTILTNRAGLSAAQAIDETLVSSSQAYAFVSTELGPALSVPVLGANKILAAYGRSSPRDLDDIAHLAPGRGCSHLPDDPGCAPHAELRLALSQLSAHATP
jgi:hypothetical protein